MVKVNKWTLGLAALGLVSLPAVVQAEEKPNQLLTALSSTTISGFVDTSAHWSPGTGNMNPPAVAFNTPSKQDGFNLNMVNLTIEKPLDESTWSAGYKVELLYGPNAVAFNPSVGANLGDMAIKQAYVAMRVPVGNGIDLKMGVFDTIIGYEVVNTPNNPNYTRSWGISMEPFQHTGLLASYQVNKVIGVSGGIANTWDVGINNRAWFKTNPHHKSESQKTWMGAVTLTAPDSMGFLAGSALYMGVVDGYASFIGNDVTSYYIGGTMNTPIKGVKLGAAFDYARADYSVKFRRGYAEAVALYASFQATEKLSLHLRGEYATLSEGYSSGGQFNQAVGGLPHEVFTITGTVQYDLWANVLTRLEVRWDHALSGRPFGGNVAGMDNGVIGSGGANENDALLLAANVIYKF